MAALVPAAAVAQQAPAGWTVSNGVYTHITSGMTCPATVANYAFSKIDGPSDPNFEGICTYSKDGEVGLIRVRHYVEGVGETPLAIQNDYGLMHPDAGGGKKIVGAMRGGPGPVVDGAQTYQIVLTNALHGFLVDCIARHTDKSQPAMDFPLACLHLTEK